MTVIRSDKWGFEWKVILTYTTSQIMMMAIGTVQLQDLTNTTTGIPSKIMMTAIGTVHLQDSQKEKRMASSSYNCTKLKMKTELHPYS